MEIKIQNMILNEFEVVEEMVYTGIIPPYYSNINILVNRLYRYCSEMDAANAEELLRQMLDKLDVAYDDEYLAETIGQYTIVQPLKRTDGINIYQEEVDAINRIKGRSNQRVAFALLIIQKVLSPCSNKLYIDNWNDVFKIISISNQAERNKTCHELYRQGAIDVPLFDNHIELLITKTDGEIHTTIKDNFDNVDMWFDKIFTQNTNLETIIMIDSEGNVREFKHTGFAGVAKILQQEDMKIDKQAIHKICKLQREQLNGVYFFILNEEWCKQGDYELRKANYIDAMKQAREILIKCKRNKNKKLKLYVRIDGGDETLTVRIK